MSDWQPAAYEEVLAFVLAQLGEPIAQHAEDDGSVLITHGDPAEVIVRITESHVVVAEHAVSWHTPHDPVVEPIEIGAVFWAHLSSDAALRAIRTLLVGARESRLAKFRVCAMCERATPPEWMHDDDVCQACAQRKLGVVY
jgi:hypothetical protein